MSLLLQIVSAVLLVFLILLFARFVVDWVMVLARSWRPQGLVAAGLEVVYSTTDPPLLSTSVPTSPLAIRLSAYRSAKPFVAATGRPREPGPDAPGQSCCTSNQ